MRETTKDSLLTIARGASHGAELGAGFSGLSWLSRHYEIGLGEHTITWTGALWVIALLAFIGAVGGAVVAEGRRRAEEEIAYGRMTAEEGKTTKDTLLTIVQGASYGAGLGAIVSGLSLFWRYFVGPEQTITWTGALWLVVVLAFIGAVGGALVAIGRRTAR